MRQKNRHFWGHLPSVALGSLAEVRTTSKMSLMPSYTPTTMQEKSGNAKARSWNGGKVGTRSVRQAT